MTDFPRVPLLTRESIRYIGFDGGSGKVAVFAGVLRALERIGVVVAGRQESSTPLGFSGSSTGSIPAALLACGLEPSDVDHFIVGRLQKVLYSNEPIGVSRPAIRVTPANHLMFDIIPVDAVRADTPFIDSLRHWEPAFRKALGPFIPSERAAQAFRRWGENQMGLDAALIDTILRSGSSAVQLLQFDGGLLSWSELPGVLNRMICDAVQKIVGRRQELMTFRQHHELFASELRLTATNLSSGKRLLFSADTTPHLGIAHAVRLCCSIPFLVKPVLLTADAASLAGASADYAGLWVDGGVLNAPAVHAFDPKPGTLEPDLFGASLSTAPIAELYTLVDEKPLTRLVARALLEFMLSGPPANLSESESRQVVQLDTEGLSGFAFQHEESLLRHAQDGAFARTVARFDDQLNSERP